MLSTQLASLLSLVATTLAAPRGNVGKRAQTVYLAGDSTMERGNSNITGWGVFLPYSLSLPVVNKAIGGRSSRSFTREGRFDAIIDIVQPNDIVVVEFGHNDGGWPVTPDNGRPVCPGNGSETCQTTYKNVSETVYTFSKYLTDAGSAMIAKGAKVIMSSQTPTNPWESGNFTYIPGRFVGYAKAVAAALGSHAMYVDHGAYTANYYKGIGRASTNKLFPQDHTHTNAAGADAVAKAFVKGLQCGGGGFLKGFVKNSTNSIVGSCL